MPLFQNILNIFLRKKTLHVLALVGGGVDPPTSQPLADACNASYFTCSLTAYKTNKPVIEEEKIGKKDQVREDTHSVFFFFLVVGPLRV